MIQLKEIKEYFESKTIKPSINSWDKLDLLLTENDKKNNLKPKYFKYVSVACFLLIGIIIWNYNLEDTPVNYKHEVVIQKDIKPKIDHTKLKPNELRLNTTEINSKNKNLPKENNLENINIANNEIIKKNTIETENEIFEKKLNTVEEVVFDPTNEKLNKNIEHDKIKTISIDSDLLLKAAEKELDMEHRDKTLLKLKNSFNQIKTYVNNVNYE
jgi:hypothetical protein